jgi:hypothetical protein
MFFNKFSRETSLARLLCCNFIGPEEIFVQEKDNFRGGNKKKPFPRSQ